jgi:hypothetical protein
MTQQGPTPDRPTPDQLAGVYVCIEGQETMTLGSAVPGAQPVSPPLPPTTDELAGISVCIEGEEKVLGGAEPPPPEAKR